MAILGIIDLIRQWLSIDQNTIAQKSSDDRNMSGRWSIEYVDCEGQVHKTTSS